MKLVIAPTYQSANYWGDIYGYDTRRTDVCVVTREEHIKQFDSMFKSGKLSYNNTLIVYGDDFGFPETVLSDNDYHNFKNLLRHCERVLYER